MPGGDFRGLEKHPGVSAHRHVGRLLGLRGQTNNSLATQAVLIWRIPCAENLLCEQLANISSIESSLNAHPLAVEDFPSRRQPYHGQRSVLMMNRSDPNSIS